MITLEQIDFAGKLSNSALAFGIQNYFVRMDVAVEKDNADDLAKFAAHIIVEFAQHGFVIADKAARWIELFGKLPEFDSLTQPTSSV